MVAGATAYETWDGSVQGGSWTKAAAPLESNAYDVASMQFAIHYMFEEEARAKTLFDDVGAALRPGGVFVATTIDARCSATARTSLPTPAKVRSSCRPPLSP